MTLRLAYVRDGRDRLGRFLATACVAGLALATAGCFNNWAEAPQEDLSRPTVRHVRHELRGIAQRGLLPRIEQPLAPGDDLNSRFDEEGSGVLSHRFEIEAALARVNELADQLEDAETCDAFLAADRPREISRVEALKGLFIYRFRDPEIEPQVRAAWERLDDVLAALDRDAWVDRQRLFALEILLGSDFPAAEPRLRQAMTDGLAAEDEEWEFVYGFVPSPNDETRGRAFWSWLGDAELDLDSQIGIGLLRRLQYELNLGRGKPPHPFDSEEGHVLLEKWVRSTDPADFSLKLSALRNSRHLDYDRAQTLCEVGADDPSPTVRVEALYNACRVAHQNEQIERLRELCDDERVALDARAKFEEVRYGRPVPPPFADPLVAARAVVYQRCSQLRDEVDPIAQDVTLIAETTVPWAEYDPPEDVRVFSFYLPLDPSVAERLASEAADESADGSESEETRPAHEAACGYCVVFDDTAYLYSADQVAQEGCETALDVAAIAHRERTAYEEGHDVEDAVELSAPAYGASLAEDDWRWGELRVALPASVCAADEEDDQE